MYDLTWSRGIVRDWANMCTRAQLLAQEFDQFQDDLGVTFEKLTLEDALTFTVAASQNIPEAGKAWDRFKRLVRKAPWKQFLDEEAFRDVLLIGLRKGKAWRQASIF